MESQFCSATNFVTQQNQNFIVQCMSNVKCVSHYFYGCEPEHIVGISMKPYAIHVTFVDFLKF